MGRFSVPEPISAEHSADSFACGEPVLDDWLKHRALKNESHFSRTYVTLDAGKIAGYYSLSSGGIARGSAPGKLRRNAPDTIPVAILGRLAVDRRYAGQGLGADLLMDALQRCAHASEAIGIAAVMIHAKSEAARHFYLNHANFAEYPPDSRILFIPIGDIIAARTSND